MKKKLIVSNRYRLFLMLFLCFLFFGLCLSYTETFSYDTFFGADNSRVFADLTRISGAHERIKVHPLFLLLIQPVILVTNGIVNNLALSVILVEACVSAGSVVLLSDIMTQLGVSRKTRAAALLLYAFSFSSLIFSAIPETFIFSGAALIGYWYFLLQVSGASPNKTVYRLFVFFGILCFGITLTNYFVYLIGLVYFLITQKLPLRSAFKRFFLINLVNGLLIFLLSLFQNLVWSECPVFFIDLVFDLIGLGYPESHYMSWSVSMEKILGWLNQIIFFPLVSPQITWNPGFSYVVFGTYRLSQRIASAALSLILFVSVIRSAVYARRADARTAGILRITFAALLFNLALHFIYGSKEAFMYTPHFLFLLVLLFAVGFERGFKPGAQRGMLYLLAALTVFVIGNNCVQAVRAAGIALRNVDKTIAWSDVLTGTVLMAVLGLLPCVLSQNAAFRNALSALGERKNTLFLKGLLVYGILNAVVCLFILFNYDGISGSVEYFRIAYLLLLRRFGLG